MEVEYVEMDEHLYRCISFESAPFIYSDTTDKEEKFEVTGAAFLDPDKQPSVDRAVKCNGDPSHTQKNDVRNGVVYLIAQEVRGLAPEKKTDNQVAIKYKIDVIHRPLIQNIAHAQVEADPSITSSGVFRRLRRSLAILINSSDQSRWLIYPEIIESTT